MDRGTEGTEFATGDAPEIQKKGVGHKVVRGSFWLILGRVSDKVIGFISQLIVARLLFPEDFGLVVLAFSIIGIVQVLSEFGFQNVIIYNQQATRRYYDTAWTMSVIRGMVVATIVILMAEPAAIFFGDERLAEVLFYLSFQSILGGFFNMKFHDFLKNLWMSRVFIHMMASRIVMTSVTIGFAFYLGNYWALVYGVLTGSVVRVVLSYVLYPYMPRLTLHHWRDIWSYSQWTMISGALRYFRKKGHTFVLGGLGQVGGVGLFQIAYEIAYLPSSEMVAPMRRALFAGYSKVKHDSTAFHRMYYNAVGVSALFAMPVSIGTGLVAHLAIPIILGERWLGAIEIVQLLAISGAVASVQGHINPVFLSLGKTRLGAFLDMFIVGLYFVWLVPLTISFGITGAAATMIIMSFISLLAEVFMMRKIANFPISGYLSASWRSVVSCLVMALSVFVSLDMMESAEFLEVSQLLIAILVGGVSYIACVVLLWTVSGRREEHVEFLVFSMAKTWLQRRRAA